MPADPLNVSFMDINSEEIARQITLKEWDVWRNVRPWEFLGLAWSKPDRETRAPNSEYTSANRSYASIVVKMTQMSKFFSHWVATMIVATPNFRARVFLLRKFLSIADELLKIGNFNGVFEIWSGISMQPAFRMTETYEVN